MGMRRKGRELALQALYQIDVSGDDPKAALRAVPRALRRAAGRSRFRGGSRRGRARRTVPAIDELIAASSENWRLGRLSHVDRNILRVATYELLCRRDVPASVAIDEAIEIAKRFGSDESATFVNGVLDHIAATVGAKERARAL